MRGFTVARRLMVTTLLTLVGSVVFIVIFSSAHRRLAGKGMPARDAPMFPAIALLVAADADARENAVRTLQHQYPDEELALYTDAGALVATTMREPFAPLRTLPADWTSRSFTDEGPKLEVIPFVSASGARFYALHREREKETPRGVGWWVLLSCAVPLVVSLFASLLVARSITRPLDRIVGMARALAAGHLSTRLAMHRSDELGVVAETMDTMAERIEALLSARTELLALVSHELRTPVARVRVALDIAAESPQGLDAQAISRIGVDLAELDRLLGDSLTWSRLELSDRTGRAIPLNREEVDSASVLHEAADRFARAWPDRELRTTLEADLPLIDADRVLLIRVVLNLLENAVKYSPAAEPIELRASSVGGGVQAEVIDRGEGIAAQDLAHAFEPFYRARKVRGEATSGGLGLGLTLCRRVIEAHGGRMELQSEALRGTTARFWLPGG